MPYFSSMHFSSSRLVLLLSLALLSACSQKKNDDAAPLPGAISGQITPADAITAVVATDATNHASSAVPTTSGSYRIEQLAAGPYTLSFTPATGYAAPQTQGITVTAGQTTMAIPVTASLAIGSITGAIQYAGGVYMGGVTAVTATDAANHTTVVVPGANGQYTFNGLSPVLHTLTFTTSSDFAPIVAQTVTVRPASTVIAAPVTLTLLTTSSFTINGTSVTASNASGIFPDSFPVANSLRVIMTKTVNTVFQQVAVYVGNFTGATGTYPLLNNPNNHADLSYYPATGTSQAWAVDRSRAGAIIITEVKNNPRRVTGTFSFVAQPAGGTATGTQTVSGSFSNAPY